MFYIMTQRFPLSSTDCHVLVPPLGVSLSVLAGDPDQDDPGSDPSSELRWAAGGPVGGFGSNSLLILAHLIQVLIISFILSSGSGFIINYSN